ncbi:unnamed protein product [Spodoptera littoralis]|uniref:Uncharacterized protein n=1 Tax=Spodoptera littoralis TaxID=7109 RepID=A0A9P0I7C2_SPOLI|nr:unnamed protein product [Spodoptera littoralis]CAH1640745.1 unnamed protein product [Spodoptera littoralis]
MMICCYIIITNTKLKDDYLLRIYMYLTRCQEGSFSLLVKKHLMFDDNIFRKYFRLNKTQFDYVLNLLKKSMQEKGRTSVKEKIALTLR